KGITIHRADCPNVRALRRNPERFTEVSWDGATAAKSFLVQIAVDSWDRPRLLEDVARTFAEHGANIVSYGGVVEDQLARTRYTAGAGSVRALPSLLSPPRNVDAVCAASRVRPTWAGRPGSRCIGSPRRASPPGQTCTNARARPIPPRPSRGWPSASGSARDA